jgi:hypothetical protein
MQENAWLNLDREGEGQFLPRATKQVSFRDGYGRERIGQQPVGSVSNYPKHFEGVLIPLTVSELLYLLRRTFHFKEKSFIWPA